jgi:hypothetical protein
MTPYSLNTFFETSLKFGSEEQPLLLLVDTGSSWLWILTDDCEDEEDCEQLEKESFHKELSETFVGTDDDKKIVYGNFVTEGKKSFDTVQTVTDDMLSVE